MILHLQFLTSMWKALVLKSTMPAFYSVWNVQHGGFTLFFASTISKKFKRKNASCLKLWCTMEQQCSPLKLAAWKPWLKKCQLLSGWLNEGQAACCTAWQSLSPCPTQAAIVHQQWEKPHWGCRSNASALLRSPLQSSCWHYLLWTRLPSLENGLLASLKGGSTRCTPCGCRSAAVRINPLSAIIPSPGASLPRMPDNLVMAGSLIAPGYADEIKEMYPSGVTHVSTLNVVLLL